MTTTYGTPAGYDDGYSDDGYSDDGYDDGDGGGHHEHADEGDGGHRPPPGSTRRRRLALIVAGVVALAVSITWVVAFSSLFGVRSVDVRGNQVITSARIAAVADIADGTPLVRVDAAAAARRIEQLPGISSAQVSTSFPSSVVITVEERTPVGYVRANGQAELIDRTGLAYRTVAHAPNGLPLFVLPTGGAARATAAGEAQVAAAMPAALRAQVDSIDALDPTAITVVLTHGRVVRWGSGADSALKARVLPALLRTGNTLIDVTDPDRPFTH